MRRNVSLLLTLAAWFFATGSQWDLAQTAAWTRMFAIYAQSMPALEAVKKTFRGDELCGVCEAVQTARETGSQESGSAGTLDHKPTGKMPLMLQPTGRFVFHCAAAELRPPRASRAPASQRAAPPTMPPRAA